MDETNKRYRIDTALQRIRILIYKGIINIFSMYLLVIAGTQHLLEDDELRKTMKDLLLL
jgi:hypothetical protein